MKHKDQARIAGVDEAGRGPLAGGVYAAAVILSADSDIQGINDSKKLSPLRRTELAKIICAKAKAWYVASATVEEIDKMNILQASLLAMKRAVEGLACAPHKILVDGLHLPPVSCAGEAIVGGDGKVASIGAASILAKVMRDKNMLKLDEQYPGYGFARHKGYPTKMHLASLNNLGVSPVHRRTFAPVRKLLP